MGNQCLYRHFEDTSTSILDLFPQATHITASPGQDESNRRPLRVQNACGVVRADIVQPLHCAWRRGKSIFGVVWKAFTLAGNFVLQGRKISFKGALESGEVGAVLREIVGGHLDVKLQLIVLSVGIGRCLDVTVNCQLEQCLHHTPWSRVMGRIEELCNVVVFYVSDWRLMERDLRLAPADKVPKSTTVSVTRRGTLTLRLTWDGIEWADNEPFKEATLALGRFVAQCV